MLTVYRIGEIREYRNALVKRYAASSAHTRLECPF